MKYNSYCYNYICSGDTYDIYLENNKRMYNNIRHIHIGHSIVKYTMLDL